MSTAQSPVSQLLERNVSLFAGKRLLIAGYMEDNYPLALAAGTESTTLFTTDYSRWRQLEALQATAAAPCSLCYDFQLAAAPPAFDALLLLLPKAKAEAHYLLANLLPHLRTVVTSFSPETIGAASMARTNYWLPMQPRARNWIVPVVVHWYTPHSRSRHHHSSSTTGYRTILCSSPTERCKWWLCLAYSVRMVWMRAPAYCLKTCHPCEDAYSMSDAEPA